MTTDLDSTRGPVASAEAPVPEVQRTEALDELAHGRPFGTLTLGELAEASRRGQGSTELDRGLPKAGAPQALDRAAGWSPSSAGTVSAVVGDSGACG
ncbi:MAG: hypothetical protein ACXVFI_08385 [Solirubrobacteraceae bacterium]